MKEPVGAVSRPHAIMITYPLQGHVIPFVNLAVHLASNGFTITFINTQFVHHQISTSAGLRHDDIFAEARRNSNVDIRYATINDGFPIDFDRSLHHDQFFEGIMHDFPALVDETVGNLLRQDPTISTLIVDTFYVWPSMIARKHNLINVSFFTEPALVLTLYYHVHLLRRNGHFAAATGSQNREDAIDYIPGVKSIMPTDLTSYLQEKEINTTVHRILEKAFTDVKQADFILINTVQELEADTIDALHRNQPCYAIGPIFSTITTTIVTSLWSESDCAAWLGSKPRGSVLYISFGSYAHTTRREIEEIARGLSLSEVNFIWVIRPDIVESGQTEVLPAGFEAEMKINGRGLIVQWCRQMEVLSNPAVGAFLTHCGWNSILESVWCGVPMICYPLLTDQFTNRKLVVDDLKIGINLRDEKAVSCEEVSRKIKWLMMEGGEGVREEVKKVRKVLEDAVTTEDGSSVRNFNSFVRDLKGKIVEKRGFVVESRIIDIV